MKEACAFRGWTFEPSAFMTSRVVPPEPANAISVPSGDHAGANAEPEDVVRAHSTR